MEKNLSIHGTLKIEIGNLAFMLLTLDERVQFRAEFFNFCLTYQNRSTL